ncbi:cytochrome c family protein [Patescibacteria group bacterium]|nr:cytochrome c family protein [Patescibacteria group bacterium]MBU2633463.1 cytochrome c family protein [Patescibacteria group bacterium]
MKKYRLIGWFLIILFVAILIGLFLTVGGALPVRSEEIEEKKVVEATALQEMSLEKILAVKNIGNVPFSHTRHELFACMECHHKGQFEKCVFCHDENAKVKSKMAFHQKCKTCHKDMKCGDCHKKEEKEKTKKE